MLSGSEASKQRGDHSGYFRCFAAAQHDISMKEVSVLATGRGGEGGEHGFVDEGAADGDAAAVGGFGGEGERAVGNRDFDLATPRTHAHGRFFDRFLEAF